uniref:Uncharacterized protein n=1 Tax=Rhizophora mucronata TaxID=61149 RepID=A0A2P2P2G3_RHIMU
MVCLQYLSVSSVKNQRQFYLLIISLVIL